MYSFSSHINCTLLLLFCFVNIFYCCCLIEFNVMTRFTSILWQTFYALNMRLLITQCKYVLVLKFALIVKHLKWQNDWIINVDLHASLWSGKSLWNINETVNEFHRKTTLLLLLFAVDFAYICNYTWTYHMKFYLNFNSFYKAEWFLFLISMFFFFLL